MAATMPKCAAEATPKDDPVNVLRLGAESEDWAREESPTTTANADTHIDIVTPWFAL